MYCRRMIADSLLTKLRAEPRLPWWKLHPDFTSLDEADFGALEPELSRWSDKERTFPKRFAYNGGTPPKASPLYRHLDLRRPDACPDDDTLRCPEVHHVPCLSLPYGIECLTSPALEGFRSLRDLCITTVDAYCTVLKDADCDLLAGLPELAGLTSLTFEYCLLKGSGVGSVVRSPHLRSLRSLELYIPAYQGVLEALAGGDRPVLAGLTTLGLAAEHLTVESVAPLCKAAGHFKGLRTLRIFAMDTCGFDWGVRFEGEDENLDVLLAALAKLLRAFKGLRRLEVLHTHLRRKKVVKGEALRALVGSRELDDDEVLPKSLRKRGW